MKICILAWGSLQWDPRSLEISDAFEPTGPMVPIEFSRISGKDGPTPRLTLVINEGNGALCPTFVATSNFKDLGAAKENLRVREGMLHVNGVGFADLLSGDVSERAMERHPETVRTVRAWLENSEFDAAIWTALASNFADVRDEPFSVDAAIRFLETLPVENLTVALEYVRRAPEPVQTEVRDAVIRRWPDLPEGT
mgnify:FL=1|jgi:hypothetical protein